MYVYIQSEPMCYTVGFYDPQGQWQPESDWKTPDEAAQRVTTLNGGDLAERVKALEEQIEAMDSALTGVYFRN